MKPGTGQWMETNGENMRNIATKRNVLILFSGLIIASLVIWTLFFNTSSVVNPNKDKNLNPDDGISYAVLYDYAEVFSVIDENEDVLRSIQKDLLFFARSTRQEFSDNTVLVGFTFVDEDENYKQNETSFFTGYFYGLEDKIQVSLTPYGRGVYTLSITNLKDSTNIDDSLSMNGQRNRFIITLPIEKSFYSIRYQLTEDRIVVSFYDGYTQKDIDEVIATINSGFGENNLDDVVYSINRVGIVNLDQVGQNLITPLLQL